eukprot:Phypoly_transcript_08136.p1 GENE.Phypoly_transcript_08136~~Phypoly_transcript_08136.p1  ORF type:complete len:430 (+),score=66.51 Phypoly_transcript_08136:1-1290(+)
MNSRVGLRVLHNQILLARNPARSVNLVQTAVAQCTRSYATAPDKSKPQQQNKSIKEKKGRNKKVQAGEKQDAEIEEADEKALSVADEAKVPKIPNLRHLHSGRSPIPGQKDAPEITDHDVRQREVMMWQEQIRVQKKEILKRVQTLATMDAEEAEEEVQYSSIEEAYKSLKLEFDAALADRKPDAVYEVITSMRSMGLRLPKKSYEAAAILFAEEQHIYKVRDVWDFMQRDEVFPDQQSFMNVVRIYCQITQYEWAMKTFFKMCEVLCPNPEAYEQIIELFSQNSHVGNLRKAEQIFHTIHRFDVKHTPTTCASFIRLLCSSGYEGDGDRAIEILKYMKSKVIGPVPAEVPKYFMDHIRKYVIPDHHFVRLKKVLRGCEHGGLPEEPFKPFWAMLEKKQFVNKIERADLAPPLEKVVFPISGKTHLRLG